MREAAAIRWADGAVPVAQFSGELDLVSAPDLFAVVSARVDGDNVVIDLTGVTFLDSSGLSCLVQLARKTSVCVVAPTGSLPRRLLDIANFETLFGIFETVDAAS